MKCSIEDCSSSGRIIRGFCNLHYQQWRRCSIKKEEFIKKHYYKEKNLSCSIEGCCRKHAAKGFCIFHYNRWKRYGDPCYAKITEQATLEQQLWSNINIEENIELCWEWTAKKRNGYGYLRFGNERFTASRLVWEIVFGEKIPKGIMACHRCDNPSCCNPFHIFLGTAHDNYRDCAEKGRVIKKLGSDSSNSKLTDSKIYEIRNKFNSGIVSMGNLAKEYSVNSSTISDIVHRRTWTHLP